MKLVRARKVLVQIKLCPSKSGTPDKGIQSDAGKAGAADAGRYGQPESNGMSRLPELFFVALAACLVAKPASSSDSRLLVELPKMMQEHMLSNMRDHLAALNEILIHLRNGELEKASTTAEFRLGVSSLESHGASHMAKFMPEEMRQIGNEMHRSASQFALVAEEGEVLEAYKALSNITSACVACHAGYRVK